jgi:hypothetical protein
MKVRSVNFTGFVPKATGEGQAVITRLKKGPIRGYNSKAGGSNLYPRACDTVYGARIVLLSSSSRTPDEARINITY